MSKHGIHVPTSFYARFTHEACCFADKFAEGRLVSVLEGGYSDQAVVTGVMAHVAGLVGDRIKSLDDQDWDQWWNTDNLGEVCITILCLVC